MRIISLPQCLRLAFLLPLFLAACSGASDSPQAESSFTAEDGILRYVPADTPYLYVGLQSMPDEVIEKLQPEIRAIAQAYGKVLQAALARAPAGEDEPSLDEATRERVSAVLEDIAGMITAEGIPEAGMGRGATAAFYGVGLLPVMRIGLTDEEKFESTVARLEKKAGKQMSVAEIDGHPYRYADAGEARLVLATLDEQAVLTLVPSGFSESLLKSVLGLSPPEENIAGSGALAALAEKYGFEPHAFGMIDMQRVAATFLDEQDGVNGELLTLMEYDTAGLSDVCKSEIRSLAAVAPRVVSGYTRIDTSGFTSNTVIELRSDIATGLQKLTAAVPGLGVQSGGLVSFGMSFDLLAAREFYAARLDDMEADPYECELLADWQAGVAKGRALLEQPVPPAAYSVHGFLAVIDDIKGMDLATKQPPTDIDMRLLVATENPTALIATGAVFMPEIGALDLKPDSKPVKLEIPALASEVEFAWIALSDGALALSVGDGSERRLGTMLAAASPQPPLFMSGDMDAKRYYGFLGNTMSQSDGGEQSAEVAEATREVMRAFEKMFSRIAFDIAFTERGVEIPSRVELAD